MASETPETAHTSQTFARTAQAGSRAARWRRSLRRLSKWCGSVLLALLLICAATYCVEYYKGSRYKPVGDPLFDRYARAVIRRQAPKLWFTDTLRCDDFNANLLPDSRLAQWEGEFGDDARYWQLRKWNAQGRRTEVDVLRAGYERGAKDAVLVLLLARVREWDGAAEVSGLEHAVMYPDSPENLARIAAEKQATLDAVEPLYAEAIALAPGQAWPYYERALSRLAREDFAGAEADFAAGNAAPQNDAFEVYPEPVLREQLLADPCGPNATLYGLMRSPYCGSYCYTISILRDKRRDMCGFVEQQPTSTLTAEFHRFLCRAAQEHGDPHIAIECLRASSEMGKRLQQNPALTPEQQATLLCAGTIPRKSFQLVWAESDLARATSPSMNWNGTGGIPFYSSRSGAFNLRNRASLTVILTRHFPRTYYIDAAWVEHVYITSADEHLTRAAQQLAELDYTTLALPEAWRESNLELPEQGAAE